MPTTPNNDAPAAEALAAKSQQSGISGRMLAIFYPASRQKITQSPETK